MAIAIILLTVIIVYRLTIAQDLRLRPDYMEKDQTNAIKGVFVLLVFISHSRGYMILDGSLDPLYDFVPVFLGQMMVIPFLFYSGYGVMEQIKKKGNSYVKGLGLYRAGKLWIHFIIVILLYCLFDLVIGYSYSLKDLLLAFVAWGSIGNSNWFVFIILVMYLFTWIVFSCIQEHPGRALTLMFILCLGLIFILRYIAKQPMYWYDTLIFYPLGMAYSMVRIASDHIMERKELWIGAFVLSLLLFVLFKSDVVLKFLSRFPLGEFVFVELYYFFFTMVLVLFTMRIKIGNSILDFFGKHVFSVYLLQRIPMMLFTSSVLHITNKYLFVAVSFLLTIVLAVLFDGCMAKVDKVFFRKT